MVSIRRVAWMSAAGLVALGVGTVGVVASYRGAPPSPLTADAVNATHRPGAMEALQKKNDGTLYVLRGCPFCCRTAAVLRLCGIPHRLARVDPLTLDGLPRETVDHYRHVPQLKIGPHIVVDSTAIVAAVAEATGRKAQWSDPRVQATRGFIAEVAAPTAFVAMNDTWDHAQQGFDAQMPEHYQGSVYRWIGAAAMTTMANKFVQTKVDRVMGNRPTGYEGPRGAMQLCLDDFHAKRGGKPFHGGPTPDIADAEMAGLCLLLRSHPATAGMFINDAWLAGVEKAMQAATPNCECMA